ncbi:MAG TPA: hypothetical protein VE308_04205 [Nitrososphaera sp.]|nr:hypothetical protein [Nitrososphaera sp.]
MPIAQEIIVILLRLDVGADEHILYKPIQIQVLHSVAEKLVANTNAIP